MAEVITKKDWVSNFTLIGKPKINDYTFKIDEKSQKSSWVYNNMNLGIDCGEKHGTVYAEMMGGYSDDRNNIIYVHGKKEDGAEDFNNRFEINWEDRFNEDILETIGDMCFITVGLEKTDKGKTFPKKFLSEYDAIAYINKHLTEDMVVNVRGSLKYSSYNGNIQVRKTINSVFLSNAEDSSKYKATFTQSILIDKDSVNTNNFDKDKGVMYVDARVLDYIKEVNGVEVKGQYPYNIQFEFEMPSDQNICKKIIDNLFKVKKGVTQITFDGDFIEGGATVNATLDDVPENIRSLIGVVFSEEEALAKCSTNGNRERRMVLRKPMVKMVGDADNKTPLLQKFEERYDEEDLILDAMTNNNTAPWDEDEADSDDNGLDWLADL